MKILAIDTTTELCSAALSVDGASISREQLDPTGHSRLILDMVQSLLAEAQCSLSDLDALACDVGPGSFTGLRIGVGVAQGLAFGADLPVVPVTSLAALAQRIHHDGLVFTAIDARMGELYWAIFERSKGQLELIDNLMLSRPDDVAIPERLKGQKMDCLGSGWDAYSSVLQPHIEGQGATHSQLLPHAVDVAYLAAQTARSKWLDAHRLSPVYLRAKVASVGTKQPLIR